MTIGFADRSSAVATARLRAKNALRVVEIDYSFDEAVFEVDSLHNVLAEKMRSLLQTDRPTKTPMLSGPGVVMSEQVARQASPRKNNS